MSANNNRVNKGFHLFFFIFLISARSSFSIELDTNSTWRHDGASSEPFHLFSLDLPAAGIATVDLTTWPGGAPAKIELRSSPGVAILRQSATHLALAVRAPEPLFLRAAAEDPHLPLGRYRLSTSFAQARVLEETFLLEPGVRFKRTNLYTLATPTKGDPEDVDPDPDSMTLANRGRLLASLATLLPASQVEKGDPEDVDPDPDSMMWSDPGRAFVDQVLFYEAPCRRVSGAELDDHGDAMACATPLVLGKAMFGKIGNAHGDDRDVFELKLTELTTVEIAVRGSAETYGVLRDHSGQPLAVVHEDFTTLAPGRYFISVEDGNVEDGNVEDGNVEDGNVEDGVGAPGAFEIMVTALSNP